MRYMLLRTSANDAFTSLFIDHYMLSDGEYAYHNTSKDGVVIEPLERATGEGGRKVLQVWEFDSDKDLRAYTESMMGRDFNSMTFNCEHFVRGFIGSEEMLFGSKQFNEYAMAVLGGLLFGM